MPQSSASHEFLDRLQSDQSERWATGERRLVEAYLADHVELAQNCDSVLDLICHEVVLRESQGEAPPAGGVFRPFPPSYAVDPPALRGPSGAGWGWRRGCSTGAQEAVEEPTGGDPAQRKTVDFRRGPASTSLHTAPARATPSLRRCGDYELISEISRGGMGWSTEPGRSRSTAPSR